MSTDAPASPSLSAACAWPDRWLADAALRRGVPNAARLHDHAGVASAWDALRAIGLADAAIIELACMVSATRRADLTMVGPAQAPLLGRAAAERLRVVPVRQNGAALTVATSDPLSPSLESALRASTNRRVDLVTASPAEIDDALARVYGTTSARAVGVSVAGSPPAARTTPSRMPAAVSDEGDGTRSRVAQLIDAILDEALRDGASDVHFEPKEDGLLVRFRVDGALYDARRLPADQALQVIRRLKVLASVDIADTLRPQDGRMSIVHEARNIDLRVSTLPLGGLAEKVVVRVLDSRVAARDLAVIGYTDRELARVKRLLDLPEGLVLVTGPTGSGKTSTLYAALRHVRRDDINIVTVEDPIEYRIDGVNQVQVNEKARMTFAASLRSILRQDPDVVLIGEMRDSETASIAVKASMTGHLVLSTLHSSDALSTLDRLFGMEIDTGALAGALKGIIGQRLVRTLCTHCAQPMTLAELPVHQQQLLIGRATAGLRRAVGCAECRGTGYRGRTLVAEIFVVTPRLQRAIARRADLGELGELARDGGTISMWESGLERVLSGVTSLHELLDNVAAPVVENTDVDAQADIDALLANLLAPDGTTATRASAPSGDGTLRLLDETMLRGIEPARATADTNASGAPVLMPVPPRQVARALPSGAPRVLIVDESYAERRQLADAFARDGVSVIEAADGEAALSYAQRLRPDMIVMDVALPRLDAVGLLQALRAVGCGAHLVVYTRQADRELHAWLGELGAEEVLSRTPEPAATVAQLRRLLATHATSAA